MVQRAARDEVPPPPAGVSPTRTPEEFGRGWVVLRDCRFWASAGGGGRPAVLMHPARGVAVLDVLPSDTPGAVEALRARLDAARFPAIFAGHLPVAHLRVEPGRMPLLPSLLDDAFAAQPPLRLPGGDAWVGAAARALTAEQPVVPRPEPRRARADACDPPRRGWRRKVAAALRTAGAVLVCLAALGGVLGAALNGAPDAPAAAGAAAAVSAEGGTPATRAFAAPPTASSPAVPAPVAAVPPPSPARGGAATSPAVPEAPPPARRQPVAEVIPPPPPPPPERAAAAPRRPEAAAAPRRQREVAGAVPPASGAGAPPPQEAAPDRCRRVSVLVGSGAPLAEADMRFFNEACIRW